MTIIDLPQQLKVAEQNIHKAGFSDRINCYSSNLLDENLSFPGQADIIWMSQFLDCFSADEIVSILKRVQGAMHKDSQIFIMETLWDKQSFEAASYSLNATSLYFTAIANGNSRMYGEKQFISLIQEAGLEVVEQTDGLGFCHSLLKCRQAS